MVLHTHTFLFADLVGFTRFTAEHGDERAADLAVSFHERVRHLADELGCQVVKAIGDAVMVRSDDGAVALTLARRIFALAKQEGFPSLRVGLDTGPAVERNNDWFGSTVNTASRVASLASAGELLITERTRDAAREALNVDFSKRRRYRLKGLPEQTLFGSVHATQPGAELAASGGHRFRHRVDLLGCDFAVVGHERMMVGTEFEVPVPEPSEAVAAGLVAFDVSVGRRERRYQNRERQEF